MTRVNKSTEFSGSGGIKALPREDSAPSCRRCCHTPLGGIQFSEAIAGDGKAIFADAERIGLKDIVSKRLGSRYKSGASRDG